SMSDRLLAPDPQPVRQAAQVVSRLAAAVHFAHRDGVLHRNLKPANVLLAADGMPKVTDFSLPEFLQRFAPEPTAVSPEALADAAREQPSGHPPVTSPATDVYARGAILFALLTGRPPFQAATVAEMTEQVRSCPPPAPSGLRPEVPP